MLHYIHLNEPKDFEGTRDKFLWCFEQFIRYKEGSVHDPPLSVYTIPEDEYFAASGTERHISHGVDDHAGRTLVERRREEATDAEALV